MQVVTNELAKWIEEVETNAFYSRLSRIEKIPDNPMGIEIRKFGNAIAFVAQNIPGPAFNKIKGIMDKDIPLLNELIQLYNDKGIPARFEITPAHATSTLYLALANLGYFQPCSFHIILTYTTEARLTHYYLTIISFCLYDPSLY